MKPKTMSLLLLVLMLVSVLAIQKVSAGTFADHKFDLTVYLEWKATDSELNNLRDTFQEFSEQLYDSTDGTHQLGTITAYNTHPTRKDDADIFLEKPSKRSGAHIFGLSNPNLHMYMDSFDNERVWVHEFGHYGYGVYDEYEDDGSAECTDDGSGHACIMYSTSATRDEFCTTSNHDADGDTRQESRRGVSCWEHMASNYDDLTVPTGDADAGPTTGADQITWVVVNTLEKPYAVVLIDRSGSMSGSKISDAKDSAKLFVDLMNVDDSIGVVSFASGVSVNYPLTKITSDAQKTAAKNTINAISAGGMTAMGDGLRTSYNQLSHLGVDTPKSIVLLSNGWHNWGTEHPTSVIPDLQAKKIEVHTIGLGSGAQEDLLRQIASETGGTYHFAPSSSDLKSIYNELAAETTAVRTSRSGAGEISEGEIKTEDVIVDSSASEVTFTLTWGGSDLDLSLQMPNGTIIDETTAATNPDVTFYEGLTYKVYRINSPANGTWSMIIEGTDITNGTEEYSVRVTLDSPISLLASLPVMSSYPTPIAISATLQKEYPIINASVIATIIREDGSTYDVTLYDDGDPAHGDSLQYDGVYSYIFPVFPGSEYFTVFNSDGLYRIHIRASSDGTAVMGIFTGEPDVPPFLVSMTEPFTRETMISTTVLGVPSDITPPSITVLTPREDPPEGLQDGVTLEATVADPSGVDWVTFSIRESDGTIIDPMFESMDATDVGSDIWQAWVDTNVPELPDGYYLLLVNASDILGNEGSKTVQFSIRNWACLELLPATKASKAGRTMPVKFSLRVFENVDPAKPFVYNEELTIVIYEEGDPDNILQTSTHGDTARDYRIDSIGELYITNFRTIRRKPTTYVVEIYRKDMLIGWFTFETVK